jgi:hypothetical protein
MIATIPQRDHPAVRPEIAFPGLLAGLRPGRVQSWGLLEVVSLFPARQRPAGDRPQFVPPLESLKLVQVPTYGTLLLQNTAADGLLIVPMHVGFFQAGAQNHATSRTLVLGAQETLGVEDCFCIQQAQGGLLQEAQQRFLMLPLGLRRPALAARHKQGFNRLWAAIGDFTRRYGITRGGHLERFLRPYFPRLMPFRQALETVPGQVGAAYFVAGRLAGIEAGPNPAFWRDVGPVLTLYCYGPAALQAERHGWQPAGRPVDLDGLADLDDLARRLQEARREEAIDRCEQIRRTAAAAWQLSIDECRHGLQVVTAEHDGWMGQAVLEKAEPVYLSLFRDVFVSENGGD